jgi:glutamyl-tRNA synthetase
MQELILVLQRLDDFSATHTELAVMTWIEAKGYHTGNIMNAFRVALVGEAKGPHLFDITEIIGKEETIERLKKAIIELK